MDCHTNLLPKFLLKRDDPRSAPLQAVESHPRRSQHGRDESNVRNLGSRCARRPHITSPVVAALPRGPELNCQPKAPPTAMQLAIANSAFRASFGEERQSSALE